MEPSTNPVPPQAPTPLSTPQPVETIAPSTPPNPPKKPTGLIATTIILAILAIGGIASAIYFFMDSNNKATSNSELQAKLDLIQKENELEVTEEQNETTSSTTKSNNTGQSEVKAIAKQIYDSVSTNISNGRFYTVFGDGSMIRIPDSDMYTSSNESYGVSSASHFYDPSAESIIMADAHNYAEAVLSSNGFVEEGQGKFLSSKLFSNANTGIYCFVSENSLPFTVDCSKDTWISNEKKNLVLALAKTTDMFYISADPNKIVNSEVSPYQRLTANGLGAALLFYRVSPDSDWQFFAGAQAPLGCSEYNTPDIKNAFAGETCYDGDQESTVQP